MIHKKIIRRDVLRRRDSIRPEERKRKDRLIMNRVFSLPEFGSAEVIFYFASFGSEVSTMPHIEEALKKGKRIVLPRVDNENRRLRLYEIHDTGEIKPGFMGIPEPYVPPERERDINEVDLVIMPGVAFDIYGNRLGYGGGYYDRLLSGLKKKVMLVAVAYEEQIVDSLPSEAHDVKVDLIVTEKRSIEISGSKTLDKEVH